MALGASTILGDVMKPTEIDLGTTNNGEYAKHFPLKVSSSCLVKIK
jgi:hypothetical protein